MPCMNIVIRDMIDSTFIDSFSILCLCLIDKPAYIPSFDHKEC